MKKYFVVSLIKNGILGGGITADSEAITYHTGKLTVPDKYRRLEMKYKDIAKATKGWLFILPTVMIEMRDGEKYKFAVFFSRERLLSIIRDMTMS